jgi:transposase
LIDPGTGEIHEAQLFVAVLGASSYTFVVANGATSLAIRWWPPRCSTAFFTMLWSSSGLIPTLGARAAQRL